MNGNPFLVERALNLILNLRCAIEWVTMDLFIVQKKCCADSFVLGHQI